MNVLMLLGGCAEERHASEASVAHCVPLLKSAGHRVEVLDVHDLDRWHQESLEAELTLARDDDPDTVVFNNTHGGRCGDGTLQGLLALSGLRYTNSGPLTSATCLDKTAACDAIAARGVRVPLGHTASAGHIDVAVRRVRDVVGRDVSVIIKPVNGGSSNGLHLIGPDDPIPSGSSGVQYRVEAYVEGTECSAVMMGSDVIGVAEVELPPSTVLDVARKFGDTPVHVPPRLPDETMRCVERVARSASVALQCRGAHRVDLRVDHTGSPVVIEVNTQPSLRPTGLYVRVARTIMDDHALMAAMLYRADRG